MRVLVAGAVSLAADRICRVRLRWVAVAVMAAWPVAGQKAVAADTSPMMRPPNCPNEIVDVYLSPLKRDEGPPITIFLKPGPPPVHLRLPRQNLLIEATPGGRQNMSDCTLKVFTGWTAIYLRTSDLAHALNIPYDQPRVQNYQLWFYALDPDAKPPSPQTLPPVDDAADREGMAQRGSWTLRQVTSGVHGQFCLDPPALGGQCYAFVGFGMSYSTGHTEIFAQAFGSATLDPSVRAGRTTITVSDVERYFAFMRRLADAVVVAPSVPSQ